MKTVFCFVLTIMISACCYGWKTQKSIKGSGNVQTEERNVTSFKEIKASRSIHVFLTQGEAKAVVVKADDNILPYLETVVKDNALEIRIVQDVNIEKATRMDVYVTVPQLKEIKATTSAQIEGTAPWEFTELNISTTTSASIDLDLTAVAIDVKATTSGSVTLKGKTEKLEIKATTSAQIKAEELIARFAEVGATTSGDVYIHVTDKLGYKLTTGANLVYKGEPRITSTAISTGGSATHRK